MWRRRRRLLLDRSGQGEERHAEGDRDLGEAREERRCAKPGRRLFAAAAQGGETHAARGDRGTLRPQGREGALERAVDGDCVAEGFGAVEARRGVRLEIKALAHRQRAGRAGVRDH